MNIPMYYVVRNYADMRGRSTTHDAVAGPFSSFSDAEVWISAEPRYLQKELEVWINNTDMRQVYS